MIFQKIKTDPGPAPDGETTAWLQVVAGVLINALSWGYSSSFGVYQLYYTTALSLPPSQVSWIGSTQVFLTFFISAFSGRSADAGLAQQTVLLGCFLGVFGTFMTSLATKYWQIFLAQGICTGLGMGLMYMPTVAIIRFSWAVRIQAIIALLFAVIILTLLQPRLPSRKAGPIIELRAFLEASYSLFTIGMFFIFLALYFAFFYINSYATTVIGVSSETAATFLVIINAITIPSRPLLGYFSDRLFNALLTLALASIFMACMLFTWIPVKTLGGMYAWVAVYGFATGGTQGMFSGALASLTHDPAKMGTRFGMVCSVLAFASLAGPPIAGGLIESMNGSFVGAQAWAGTVTLIGSLFITAARWSDRKAVH
ncbi:major facilitator superfamily transporter [Diaporthe amygdali]|uniref:major facilitator superfamily transporter n=1 Tax=Phomopsis amygdali TaxID=1214568 RepID=UPI0022FE2D54|nr:major facilitator superfamily transporter [Diaporthe amygdali]KAJ0107220.1 major facilitator superfamily transporter [Diaporthe amygdali]